MHDKPFLVPMICAVLLMPLSILALFYSRTDTVPKWYKSMEALNLMSCLLVLFVMTKELNALLEAVGIIVKRSHTFIGCTLYTWGSGWSDILLNLSLARKGLPRMAYSACYGSIIFCKATIATIDCTIDQCLHVFFFFSYILVCLHTIHLFHHNAKPSRNQLCK